MRYMDEHLAEAMEVHNRIEERIAKGNPPEIEAKLEGARARMTAWMAANKARNGEAANGTGHPG